MYNFNDELATHKPSPHSDFNACSFEFDEHGKIDCDWLQLAANRKPPFAIAQSHDRIFANQTSLSFWSGVESHVTHERRFLVAGFPQNEPGYLLSPVFARGEGEKVRVSFFHALTSSCHQVEAFLLPGKFDVTGVERLPSRFLVVRGEQSAWQQSGASVPVNSSFNHFKVSRGFFYVRFSGSKIFVFLF